MNLFKDTFILSEEKTHFQKLLNQWYAYWFTSACDSVMLKFHSGIHTWQIECVMEMVHVSCGMKQIHPLCSGIIHFL